jgi:hypothetical protein
MRAIVYLTSTLAALSLAYAFLEQDFPTDTKSPWVTVGLVLVIVFLAVLWILIARSFSRARNFLLNIQISCLSIIAALLITEALFRLVPGIFPDNLRVLVETGAASASLRPQLVDILPYSPYAKPRANVTIHVPGYYGPKDTFVYEWRTDKRGFKNGPSVAERDTVDVVAVGSSFTEAMGVAVEDTWASKLSKVGYVTYSLGVEGYAPSQYSGAYERFGRALKPRWIIIGYVVGDNDNEIYFSRGGPEAGQELPSAIGRLAARENLEQQNVILYLETSEGYRVPIPTLRRHTFVTSALVTLAKNTLKFYRSFDIRSGIAPGDTRFLSDKEVADSAMGPLKYMGRYRGEILAVAGARQDASELARSPFWIRTERAFESIIEMAREDGARVLIVLFPSRGAAYFEREMGRPLPADGSDNVQSALLRTFAQRHGAEILDLTRTFQSYVATLNETSTIDQYPYLKVDGHLSVRGNELGAAALARFLSDCEARTRSDSASRN